MARMVLLVVVVGLVPCGAALLRDGAEQGFILGGGESGSGSGSGDGGEMSGEGPVTTEPPSSTDETGSGDGAGTTTTTAATTTPITAVDDTMTRVKVVFMLLGTVTVEEFGSKEQSDLQHAIANILVGIQANSVGIIDQKSFVRPAEGGTENSTLPETGITVDVEVVGPRGSGIHIIITLRQPTNVQLLQSVLNDSGVEVVAEPVAVVVPPAKCTEISEAAVCNPRQCIPGTVAVIVEGDCCSTCLTPEEQAYLREKGAYLLAKQQYDMDYGIYEENTDAWNKQYATYLKEAAVFESQFEAYANSEEVFYEGTC